MSRVEPKDQPAPREAEKGRRQQPVDRTPDKAEGDEQTVNEALENSEEVGKKGSREEAS